MNAISGNHIENLFRPGVVVVTVCLDILGYLFFFIESKITFRRMFLFDLCGLLAKRHRVLYMSIGRTITNCLSLIRKGLYGCTEISTVFLGSLRMA